MIDELGDPRIVVVDPEQHCRIARSAAGTSLQTATILGHDDPAAYDRETFTVVRDVVGQIQEVQEHKDELDEVWPSDGPRILMIERGPSPPFYRSEQSEVQSSGDERRSIPNFSDIYQSVQHSHRAALAVIPETLPLTRQFALFATADIIVAQHGAALANMIWARPRATVIEIYPDDVRIDFFRDLARCLGLRHRRFRQKDSHAAIDPDELAAFVDEAVDHRYRSIESHLRRISFRALRRTSAPRARVRSFSRKVMERIDR